MEWTSGFHLVLLCHKHSLGHILTKAHCERACSVSRVFSILAQTVLRMVVFSSWRDLQSLCPSFLRPTPVQLAEKHGDLAIGLALTRVRWSGSRKEAVRFIRSLLKPGIWFSGTLALCISIVFHPLRTYAPLFVSTPPLSNWGHFRTVIDACYTPASFATADILQQKGELFDQRIGTVGILSLRINEQFIDFLNRLIGPMTIYSRKLVTNTVQKRKKGIWQSVLMRSRLRRTWC